MPLVNLNWGLASIFLTDQTDGTMIRLGMYLLCIGVSCFIDSWYARLKPSERKYHKRRLRIGIPVIFTAMMPLSTMNKINKFLTKATDVPSLK